MVEHVRAGDSVARVHTGDPAVFGAILEQMALLRAEGVECEISARGEFGPGGPPPSSARSSLSRS